MTSKFTLPKKVTDMIRTHMLENTDDLVDRVLAEELANKGSLEDDVRDCISGEIEGALHRIMKEKPFKQKVENTLRAHLEKNLPNLLKAEKLSFNFGTDNW